MSFMAAAILGGAAIGAGGAYLGGRSANKGREKAFGGARSYLESLRNRGSDFLTAAFGDSLNPEEFLYNPIDLTQSQLDTIQGNLKALPSARKLVDRVNPRIWGNDQKRIRAIMPGFDSARDSYLGTMRSLQDGKLPFSDAADIVAGRAGASGVLSTPGGARNATLRDLGLSRMDAMREGQSLFGQFVNIAQQISPVEHQMRPQQMFFTPQERAQMDIQQAQLEMTGRSQAELARAMPDPAQNALVNAEIGVHMASLGANHQSAWGPALQALGGGVTMAGMAYGSRNSWQQGPPQQQARPYTDYDFSGGHYRQAGSGTTTADFSAILGGYQNPTRLQT